MQPIYCDVCDGRGPTTDHEGQWLCAGCVKRAEPEAGEVRSDGRMVWVNAPLSVGRFGPNGYELGDVVTAGKPDQVGWATFCDTIHQRHGITVGYEHKPKWLCQNEVVLRNVMVDMAGQLMERHSAWDGAAKMTPDQRASFRVAVYSFCADHELEAEQWIALCQEARDARKFKAGLEVL